MVCRKKLVWCCCCWHPYATHPSLLSSASTCLGTLATGEVPRYTESNIKDGEGPIPARIDSSRAQGPPREGALLKGQSPYPSGRRPEQFHCTGADCRRMRSIRSLVGERLWRRHWSDGSRGRRISSSMQSTRSIWKSCGECGGNDWVSASASTSAA
jgi:hypothetical protein